MNIYNDLKVNEIYENLPNYLSYNVSITSLLHPENWVFSFSENFFIFSYNLSYYFLENEVYQDNYNTSKKYFWFKTIISSEYNFLASLIMDQLTYIYVSNLPFFNEFFKNIFSSFELNNIFMYHPEYFFIFKGIVLNFYTYYLSNFYISNQLLVVNESFITPLVMLPQLISIYFAVMLFLITYFTYFNNPNSEDNIIDHDYLAFNVTVEAEEEIGSMDDMLLTSVILLYIFLWFFWIYSWSSLSINPQLIMTFYLFPFIYFIIFFIPISLLYDYGSYFLTYLNGVGKSSVMMLELLFDYIAVSIFFLRLMVQNVRLVFMLFTYAELHELVVMYNFDKNNLPFNEDVKEKEKSFFNFSSWYLLFKLPAALLNWLYELFHTFFMVIFQFIAFFAMIFWLFLFLYTMFVSETQENYFTQKRLEKKSFYKNISNYKLSFSN